MEPKEKRTNMDLLIKILAIIGGLAILVVVLGAAYFIQIGRDKTKIPSRAILELNFENGLVEISPQGIIDRFSTKSTLQIRSVVSALQIAAKDKRVKGLVAHISGDPIAFANTQEIRNAIIKFRASGKPAIAFAETFSESGPGNSAYYLATAFDSISLQPSGDLGITGIFSESPFLKGTLDKLNVKPQLDAREEYKTARNLFTESKYTTAHREVTLSIINSVQNQFVKDVAEARKIDVDTMRRLISAGPYTAAQALKLRLVDKIEYRDQLYDRLLQKPKAKNTLLYLQQYARLVRLAPKGKKTVALIYGDGTIVQGQSKNNPFNGSTNLGAQTVAAAFRAAVRDKDVAAIIFRINSPGGSYIGSDVIWRETVRAQKAGKPVIVTMGAVAGSGGYYVAMNADKIIAQPSTITGSIGVVSGKFVTSGLFNKMGISFDHVETDSNATIWSSIIGYSDSQWKYIQQSLDTIYDDFVSKVAVGRKLNKDQVFKIAKGRIYTGSEALKLGLVDTLGGFPEAISTAKKLIGITNDKPVRIKIFPMQRPFWKQLFSGGPKNSDDVEINTISNEGNISNSSFRYISNMLTGLIDQREILLMENIQLN